MTAGASGRSGPLNGVRVVESSALGAAAITSYLVDLGADVIKVEPPGGDYVRQTTWPIIDGVSLMHLHINRGKRSVVLDLRRPEGVQAYLELARHADVVVEAMRPGGLERRGLGYERLREVNPKLVFCTLSGYGVDGPYANLPSHGVGFDAWAGVIEPGCDEFGFDFIPDYVPIGINAGPLYGALGILAAVLEARQTGEGRRFEVSQAEAAAAFDWSRIEAWRQYDRWSRDGDDAGEDQRSPGMADMKESVRYQIYETSDARRVLLMASEQAFWRRFCDVTGRPDLFECWPGSTYGEHARGNRELRGELRNLFFERTLEEWMDLATAADLPLCPVNSPRQLSTDPHFVARAPWLGGDLGVEQLRTPIRFADGRDVEPSRAPTPGQHSHEVLAAIAGYDDALIARLRDEGVVG